MRKKKMTALFTALALGIAVMGTVPCLGSAAGPGTGDGPDYEGSEVVPANTGEEAEWNGDPDSPDEETDWDTEDEYDENNYMREHWYDDEQPEANISSMDQAPDGKIPVKGKTGEIQAGLTAYNKVQVTVKAAEVTKEKVGKYLYGTSQFYLYRSESPDGPFSCLDSSYYDQDYQNQVCSLSDYGLKHGTAYYYKVRQKYVGYTSKENYWEDTGKKAAFYFDSSVVSINTLADKEVWFQLSLTKPDSASLTWSSLDDAVESYTIYRAEENNNGTYEPIQTVLASEGMDYSYSGLSYEYTDKTLVYGKKYFYKVSAHTSFGTDTPCDLIKSVMSGPDKVAIKKMKCPKPGEITITWKKVAKATSYAIYRSTDNVNFKKVKTVKDPDKLTASFTKLAHGKVYYFKVRAYDDSNGTRIWGIENESVSKAMDYYLCPASDTSWEQRFGNLDFKTQKQAGKHMKVVKVKVWDINQKTNKKYTRHFYLSIHKSVAPTVKKIFNEIYRGKEKFPIHSIGGYAWRSDSSTSQHHYGLAIDINPDENCMPSRNVGSYWRPGKDPYSITPDGDVVTIMEKYGFYWLGEYDAMHFSVTGT